MRLTVGPLPAAVYWRRRAVVLVGIALIVLVVAYACGSSADSTAGLGSTTAPPTTTKPSPTATSSRPTTPAAPTTTTQPAFTLPPAGATTGPCADAEMELTASAASAEVPLGQPVEVTITIKNISNRTCKRDIGADVQELYLLDVDGRTKIWSTDDCSPNRGSNLSSFSPGRQVSYTLTWNGRRSRTGTGAINCQAPAPQPAVYQLVARLGAKTSAPFALRLKA